MKTTKFKLAALAIFGLMAMGMMNVGEVKAQTLPDGGTRACGPCTTTITGGGAGVGFCVPGSGSNSPPKCYNFIGTGANPAEIWRNATQDDLNNICNASPRCSGPSKPVTVNNPNGACMGKITCTTPDANGKSTGTKSSC